MGSPQRHEGVPHDREKPNVTTHALMLTPAGSHSQPQNGLKPQWTPAIPFPQLSISSTWTAAETEGFPLLLLQYGSNWTAIAARMETKTPTMVREYFERQKQNNGSHWEDIVKEVNMGLASDLKEMLSPEPSISGRREVHIDTTEPPEAQPVGSRKRLKLKFGSMSANQSTPAPHQHLLSPRTTQSPFTSTQKSFLKRSRDAKFSSSDSGSSETEYPTIGRGIAPDSRHDDIPSMNELQAGRDLEMKNAMVEEWLTNPYNTAEGDGTDAPSTPPEYEGTELEDFTDDEYITENIMVPRQLYYNTDKGGLFTQTDLELIRESRNWMDPPLLSPISSAPQRRYQPDSSQAAIERYERLCRDNQSVASGATSCGTKRVSSPPISEIWNMNCGNILKMIPTPRNAKMSTPAHDLTGLAGRPSIPREESLALKQEEEFEVSHASDFAEFVALFRAEASPSLESSLDSEFFGAEFEEESSKVPTVIQSLKPSDSPIMKVSFWKGNLPFTLMDQADSIETVTHGDLKHDMTKPGSVKDNPKALTANAAIVNAFSTKATKVNSVDMFGDTPILRASRAGNLRRVKVLLGNGVDPTVANIFGFTPLYFAASNGHTEVAELLLGKGVDIAARNHYGSTPLAAAASHGHNKIVKLLLSKGADINVANFDGITPISTAASGGHLDVVQLLLDNGADITVADNCGLRPFEVAKTGGHEQIYRLLLSHRVSTTVADKAGLMPVYATPSKTPGNSTAHGPTMSEEALVHCEALASKTAQVRRQVGLARVHIEILSLQKDVRTRKSDDETTDGSDIETEYDEMDEDGGAATHGKDNATEPNQAADSSEDTSFSSTNTHPNSLGGNNENEDSERGGNDKSKPPPKSTAIPKENQKLRRFACPYQAFEAYQSCFRQGPRNPEGGCASISRLKQHLNRRHMLSYRCQRCWRSFESKIKLASHEKQQEPCEAKEMPSTERFMSAEHEAQLERLTCSGSDEETWWSLFQRLIPGMQERELNSLKNEFFPYYIYVDSFMIPAITFSNALFQPPATDQPSLQDMTPNGYELLDQTSSDSPSVVDPRLFSIPSTPSYSLSVPLLEAPIDYQQHSNTQPPLVYTPPQSAVASTNSVSDMPRTNRALDRVQQQVSDQTQLRRNYERLKVRNTRTEAENGELRENNRCARADIGRMDSVLDDLLAAEDLPSHLFDKLTEVSEILLSIKSRIR